MHKKAKRAKEWAKAQEVCHLSDEDVRMAREVGMNPRGLIKNIPSPSEPWKAPVNEWIRRLYAERQEKTEQRRVEKIEEESAEGFTVPPDSSPEEFEEEDEQYTGRIIDEEDIDYDDLRNRARWQMAAAVGEEEAEAAESMSHEDLLAFYGDHLPPTRREVDEENALMIRRHREFRMAAQYAAEAIARVAVVQRIVLFGSVAKKLWKEVPRFCKFRRAGVAIWHECKDVDLAVWVNELDCLAELQKARKEGLKQLHGERNIGVAHHQVEVFLFAAGSDDYLGRLCVFRDCPRRPSKMECHAPNCGSSPFLQNVEGFRFHRDALRPEATNLLFARDRAAEAGDVYPDDLPF